MASSRSSLASDLHDVGTPGPSSPLPPPDSSTPLPQKDQDNKQRSRSPTPQPPTSSSQVQEENGETGATLTSAIAPTNPPEISVQSTEDTTITGVSDTAEDTVAHQLSLSEAGAQVEASTRDEGEEMKEKEVGKENGIEEEEGFGDFQGAEGVMSAAPVTSSTAVLDSGSSPTEDGEQPQSAAAGSASQTPGQVDDTREPSPSAVLTDTTTNLQPTSADSATGIHTYVMHVCSYLYFSI